MPLHCAWNSTCPSSTREAVAEGRISDSVNCDAPAAHRLEQATGGFRMTTEASLADGQRRRGRSSVKLGDFMTACCWASSIAGSGTPRFCSRRAINAQSPEAEQNADLVRDGQLLSAAASVLGDRVGRSRDLAWPRCEACQPTIAAILQTFFDRRLDRQSDRLATSTGRRCRALGPVEFRLVGSGTAGWVLNHLRRSS